MDPAASLVSWPNVWATRKWATSGGAIAPANTGQGRAWHQTLKNRILLDNYFFPADLEAPIEAFVDHYNHRR
jgi:hypothetical protein